jgi:ABC-type sugar transport system ATPase subunit
MEVELLEHLGGVTLLHGPLRGTDQQMVISLEGISEIQIGDSLRFSLPPELVHLFDAQTDRRIG